MIQNELSKVYYICKVSNSPVIRVHLLSGAKCNMNVLNIWHLWFKKPMKCPVRDRVLDQDQSKAGNRPVIYLDHTFLKVLEEFTDHAL